MLCHESEGYLQVMHFGLEYNILHISVGWYSRSDVRLQIRHWNLYCYFISFHLVYHILKCKFATSNIMYKKKPFKFQFKVKVKFFFTAILFCMIPAILVKYRKLNFHKAWNWSFAINPSRFNNNMAPMLIHKL